MRKTHTSPQFCVQGQEGVEIYFHCPMSVHSLVFNKTLRELLALTSAQYLKIEKRSCKTSGRNYTESRRSTASLRPVTSLFGQRQDSNPEIWLDGGL